MRAQRLLGPDNRISLNAKIFNFFAFDPFAGPISCLPHIYFVIFLCGHFRSGTISPMLSKIKGLWNMLLVRTFFLVVALSVSVIAYGESVEVALNFTIQSGSEASMSGRIGGSTPGTDTAEITGNYTANVSFDRENLVVNTFTFTGGTVALGDLDFNFSGNANVIGFGSVPLSVAGRTRGLRETPSTPSSPGTVLPSGNLVASEHTFTLNAGTLRLVATALGSSDTETTNYSQNPESEPASGTANISVTRMAVSDLEEVFTFTLLIETSETQSEIIDGTTTTLTLAGEESTISKASITLPTDLGTWVEAQEISESEVTGSNAAGLPYLLLHAFDLDAEASALPIISGLSAGGTPEMTIDLPESGLRNGLSAQYRAALNQGSWSALPSVNISGGNASLGKGASGQVKLSYPAGDSGFIKLVLTPPP